MATKIIEGTEIRVGTFLLLEGAVCEVKKMGISKSGKHGHAKVRFEATDILTGKKKVMVFSGHARFDVPMIEKKKAQVLSINNGVASLMDSESFENIELPIPEEIKEEIKEGGNAEYWDVEGGKFLKRGL